MSKTVSSIEPELFATDGRLFIALFLTLFSLLFVFTGYVFAEKIYVAVQRKFIVPQVEREFGFRGGTEKYVYDGVEYQAFTIKSVEPRGVFDRAGIKPHDMPMFYGCRFFEIARSNEAMFYRRLDDARRGGSATLTIVGFDEYVASLNTGTLRAQFERNVGLSIERKP